MNGISLNINSKERAKKIESGKSVIVGTETSRDISDEDDRIDENEDNVALLLKRQSALLKRRVKSIRRNDDEDSEVEDEMIRQYRKSSNALSIPNLFELVLISWKFIKGLNWRVVATVCIILGSLFALKLAEESYMESKRGGDVIETDLYQILQVPKSATKRDIERTYRRMSIEWHPDKNPDCPQCMKKFQEISNAYSILSNKKSREIYDKSSSSFSSIDSIAVTLTSQNFDELVTSTLMYQVWVIQVFTDLDPLCRHIAPAWEEAVLQLDKSIEFGRINARTTKVLLSRLPVKVRIFPTIIMLFGQMSEIYQNIFQMTSSNFLSWIVRYYPSSYQRLYDTNTIESFLKSSSNSYSPIMVVSPHPSLPLSIRSKLYHHRLVYQFAHTLNTEIKSLSQSWNLSQPDRYINIVRFQHRILDDELNTLPKPLQVYPVSPNDGDENVAMVFRKIRRVIPAHLTLETSPILCGNDNDAPGSLCLVRVLEHQSLPQMLQFTTPMENSDINDEEEVEEQSERNQTGSFGFLLEVTDRVSAAAQVLMHGAKKVCRFQDSEFWGQGGSRRRLKKPEDDDNETFDIEKFLQLTYMVRPPGLPRWFFNLLSWIRPFAIRQSFFACHDLWGNVLKESDLLIYQRSSGRLLPLQRVETSLTSAVEIASDIFNGFIDIDISSQLRFLGAPYSKDWRGIDSKSLHSLWDERMFSCDAPITITSILTTVLTYFFASKMISSIVIIGAVSFIWFYADIFVNRNRERREP